MTQREPYSYQACVNYRTSTVICRADIDPVTVTDDEGRLPCVVIRRITGQLACPKLQLPTAPATGEVGEMAKSLTAILAGRCPKCGGPISAEMEFNNNVLAMPCRHVIRSERS